MGELTALLDGSIDDVKAGLAGKSHVDLLALQKAEQGGKTRKGVLEALDTAISTALADEQARNAATSGAADTSGQANIAPAEEIDTSGAPQQIVPDVDLSHPAVDNDPRAGTTVDQNRIDFNDPSIDGRDAVEQQLAKQA
ncbi:MAG: hypothetical protein PGN09_07635 [Sphingomonas fennica]